MSAPLELVGVTGRVSLDRHRHDIFGPLDLQRCTCRQCGINRRVQRPAARVWLVAYPLALEDRAQVAEQHRGIVAVRLIQLEKPKAAAENVARPGEPGLRQNRREYAGAGSLAGLHPLGQGAVQNALTVPCRVTVRNAERGQHLLRLEPQ